jgi:hypothetical protein
LFGLPRPPNFVQAWFITAVALISKFVEGLFLTILPLMIPDIHGRTHTYQHTQTHKHTTPNPDLHTYTQRPTKLEKKKEAIGREHAIMCTNKQEIVKKEKTR